MQSKRSRRPFAEEPSTAAPSSMHALQSSALARLSKLKGPPPRVDPSPIATSFSSFSFNRSHVGPSSLGPSISLPQLQSTTGPSAALLPSTTISRATDDSTDDRRKSRFEDERPRDFSEVPSATLSHAFSASSSISLNRTLPDMERSSAFFDSLEPRRSFSSSIGTNTTARTVEELGDFGFQPFHLSLDGIGDHIHVDDEEDRRDLNTLAFLRSIRMNIGALSSSSADLHACSHDVFSISDNDYDDKVPESVHEPTWIENNYAHLISRLAVAHDGAEHLDDSHVFDHRQGRFEQGLVSNSQATPQDISSRDSSLAVSLTSTRSSSDVVESDEIRTPPESSFDAFEPSPDQENRESTSKPLHADPVQPLLQPSHHAGSSISSHELEIDPRMAPADLNPAFHLFRARAQLSRDQFDSPVANTSCSIDDSAELELLSDDFVMQRRAAGKAKQTYPHDQYRQPSQSEFGHERRRSSIYAANIENNKPFTRLGPQDVAFSASTTPERSLSSADCADMIVSRYPSICDAPSREFGEDGQPLPPTKKQETSEGERKARREALKVKFCAKQRLSLIKAVVVMESRHAHWKRIGPYNPPSSNQSVCTPTPGKSDQVGQLPSMPSPWSMEIRHEQLDIAQIKGKSKKTIELASLRTNAQCVKCDGSGLGACMTCKGEQADECFWCNGTGREKTRAQASCRRCQGAGVLKCNTCSGGLRSRCRSCEGTGTGEYGFHVDVTVKRVDMPAVPLATLFPQFDPASTSFEPSYDEVKAAAKLALCESITQLTDARALASVAKGGKAKNKDMVPVMAACMWENSTTHVVSVDVPLAAKFKKGATPALRPEGLHRKIATQRRYFTVPTDEDLRPIELSEEEVKKLGAPLSSTASDELRSSPSKSPARAQAGAASFASSPSVSTTDLGGSLQLGTPEQGGSVSGYSTPTRVPSPHQNILLVKPAPKEFVQRPSPLSQLPAATSTRPESTSTQQGKDSQNFLAPDFDFPEQGRFAAWKARRPSAPSLGPSADHPDLKVRRPSAGQVLTKTLSSSILNKLGSRRDSS